MANLIERGVALTDGAQLRLEQQETAYIRWVLEQTGGNKTRAAEILGLRRCRCGAS